MFTLSCIDIRTNSHYFSSQHKLFLLITQNGLFIARYETRIQIIAVHLNLPKVNNNLLHICIISSYLVATVLEMLGSAVCYFVLSAPQTKACMATYNGS